LELYRPGLLGGLLGLSGLVDLRFQSSYLCNDVLFHLDHAVLKFRHPVFSFLQHQSFYVGPETSCTVDERRNTFSRRGSSCFRHQFGPVYTEFFQRPTDIIAVRTYRAQQLEYPKALSSPSSAAATPRNNDAHSQLASSVPPGREILNKLLTTGKRPPTAANIHAENRMNFEVRGLSLLPATTTSESASS
jgi:hypothetical protein